jgi:hypothetical protein
VSRFHAQSRGGFFGISVTGALTVRFKTARIIPCVKDIAAILFNVHGPSSLLWPKVEAAIQVALNGGFFHCYVTRAEA